MNGSSNSHSVGLIALVNGGSVAGAKPQLGDVGLINTCGPIATGKTVAASPVGGRTSIRTSVGAATVVVWASACEISPSNHAGAVSAIVALYFHDLFCNVPKLLSYVDDPIL